MCASPATTARRRRAGRAGRVSTPARTSSTTGWSATAPPSTSASTTWPGRRAGPATSPRCSATADQGIDPRTADGARRPAAVDVPGVPARLRRGTRPARRAGRLAGVARRASATTLPAGGDAALATEPDRPAEHGVSAFLSDAVIAWLAAPGRAVVRARQLLAPAPALRRRRATGRAPTTPTPCPTPARLRSGPCRSAGGWPPSPRPPIPTRARRLQAQYLGMVSDVDAQLGRVLDAAARPSGCGTTPWWCVTSDHGEQLGDQGTLGKGGPFESSYHVPGIVRDPRHPETHGRVVDEFTENVDVFPTICEAIGRRRSRRSATACPSPRSCAASEPPWWRDAAHWEYDWRWEYISRRPAPLALGPPARVQAPRGAALGVGGLRAVRRRGVALLRPRRRPDVAHRGHRSGGGARARPGHAHVAVPPCRPYAERHAASYDGRALGRVPDAVS